VDEVSADTPNKVAFTGRLTNADGPVNGSVNVTLTLFDAATGGTDTWSQDFNGVTAEEGMVYLEMTQGIETAFTGEALFLEIKVDGTAMSPRIGVYSVPYAHRAAVAGNTEKVGALSASEVAGKEDHVSDSELNTALEQYISGITTSSSSGLQGGSSSGEANLGIKPGGVTASMINSSQVQKRVSGSCGVGKMISAINEDGSVSCRSDVNTHGSLQCISTAAVTVNATAGTINTVQGSSCPSGYAAVGAECNSAWFDVRLTTSRLYLEKAYCKFWNESSFARPVNAYTRCCKVSSP